MIFPLIVTVRVPESQPRRQFFLKKGALKKSFGCESPVVSLLIAIRNVFGELNF